MATNTITPEESPAKTGDSSFLADLKKFWDEFWEPYPSPLKMYPEEAREVIRYQARRDRDLAPHPCLGEASEAHTCFFLRKYVDKREIWWVDTEVGEIVRLAFFAKWEGQPQHFDLEIGVPKL